MRVKGKAKPTRIYTAAEALGVEGSLYDSILAKHHAMLDTYRSRNWDGAEAAISECEALGVTGLSSLYHVYRNRIAEWRQAPPPDDWDGTFTATSK
jgi:adenylate cyclase